MDKWKKIEWIAMVITFIGTALTTSLDTPIRAYAFSILLISNTMWAVWGWKAEEYPILFTYVGYFIINAYGAINNFGWV